MSDNGKKLVIVESPSKAKTIGKYLGNEYVVKASMGHLRDLPKSTLSVDIENDFEPVYVPMHGKEEIISSLKKAAKSADEVYLATDPDREGEAISWHLKTLLDIPEEKAKRVTFNEITKNVVTQAITAPREIDLDLVNAQQARRILDRIVGYQLSPLLWKKVRKGLSAGRVQSVATRLVVDRENEIRAFVPQEYWSLAAHLSSKDGRILTAQYYGDPKKNPLTCEEQVNDVVAAVSGKDFTVNTVKRSEKKRSPAPPFITSTLQQEASRKLNMTPKRTMAVAQQLYEGIDVAGEGTVGLITYMRTDSLRISEEALAAAGELIRRRFGDAYYNGTPRRFKSKGNAQDAHEAIRPSNVHLTPEDLKGDLNRDQLRLYRLIWDRFIASQMKEALYDSVAADLSCGKYVFHSSDQVLKFAGFTAIYVEGRDDDGDEAVAASLPNLTEGECLRCEKTEQEQHFTQPPARYTEATLVRAMEEKGVGRPSTYASIVSTIQDKEYVLKKEKHLTPTPLGEVVNGLMMDHFKGIINIGFTAEMEERLDKVEEGEIAWKQVLRDFYTGFHEDMEKAEIELKEKRIKVPDEVTDEICELCGRKMVIKSGRFGRFLACPGYPECKNAKPLVEKMPGRCPTCGSAMLKRKSKKGYAYYACEKGAECGFMTWDVPTAEDCPFCGETLFKKAGKGKMKPFCINAKCENFLPEDKRGYYKKSETASAEKPAAGKKKTAAKKPAAKKTATKKKEAKDE